ncbi:transposase [Lipingzhangella sp. LS1_29]|uniref:Transposase n=1 Tax=Lipingzhangella rawalii TaxID=2055835 RepID=A0ABU2HBH4_9ACTN|nr:transposase [Lipingzhangella rawalii]MDS1272681.1 transposase [Lipingzhangella rawalii]
MSVLDDAAHVESLSELSRFRAGPYDYLTRRPDALFELADALLCTEGPVKTRVDLALAPEHRRGHGALYARLNQDRIYAAQLRRCLAAMPLPRAATGGWCWRPMPPHDCAQMGPPVLGVPSPLPASAAPTST